MRKISLYIVITSVLLLAGSCAKDVSESTDTIYKRVLDAWIRVNYGNLAATSSGLYILDRDYGTGTPVGDSSYVFANYTVQDLTGNFTDFNTQEMARLMGTYADTAHYAPAVWRMGTTSVYDGIAEILKGMKVGGHVKAAIPPSLMKITTTENTTNNTTTTSSGNQGATENAVSEISVMKVVEDIDKYEESLLKDFAESYYPGLDTTSAGFYFLKTLELPDADTIAADASIKVRYIGKLLDGYCFDTNIQDTAKFYRRYGGERSALSVTFKTDEASLQTDNSIIGGFAKTIRRMRYGERAISFFKSSMGYEAAGSTNIPSYAPLFFEVWIEPKE